MHKLENLLLVTKKVSITIYKNMVFLFKTYPIEYEYLNTGNSPTLLLLHGWGGNKNSFAKIKQILQSSFNILSISMPPYNETTIPLTMYDYRNLILNLLRSLNISKVAIICHSFGLRVSLLLATSNIVIEKIIVTGGAGIKLKSGFFKKLTLNFHSILLNNHPEFFTKFASSDYINLSSIDKITFKNIVNLDLTKHIKLLNCPALLFWGTKDNATPIKMLKIFTKLHPNSMCKIIKNGTHFCYLTHSDLFVDCCQKFLLN